MSVHIKVLGDPVAKGRPRFSRGAGGRPTVYTDAKTASYELKIKQAAFGKFDEPFSGPVSVELAVHVGIPRSWSKKRASEAENAPCIVKPDLDNYIKMLDALNGVAWVDDSQICEIKATKVYSSEPGLDILISEYKQID